MAASEPGTVVQRTGTGQGMRDCLYAYTGRSMYPTLRSNDFFAVSQTPYDRIRPGDVILFNDPTWAELVIHRVVRSMPSGLKTQGDHCAEADDWTVHPENIVGKVTVVYRGASALPITGGWQGLALLALWRFFLRARESVLKFIQPAAIAGLLSGWAEPWLRPSVVTFRTPSGTVTRLIARNRLIGEFDLPAQRWRIKRFYRLLIDESKYPAPLQE